MYDRCSKAKLFTSTLWGLLALVLTLLPHSANTYSHNYISECILWINVKVTIGPEKITLLSNSARDFESDQE